MKTSNFKNTLSLFTGMIQEQKNLVKSEIFRKIYKLPVRPLTEKQLEKAREEIEFHNKNYHYFDDEQMQQIYDCYNYGLAYFSHDILKKIIADLETIFHSDNPTFTPSDIEIVKNLPSEHKKEFLAAKQELNEMLSFGVPRDVKFIKEEYKQACEMVKDSHRFREATTISVFKNNSGRFSQFLKSKKKLDYLTRAERKEFDSLAQVFEMETQNFIDCLENEYPQKLKNKRLKELKSEYDSQIDSVKRYEKRLEELEEILNKYE